MKRRGSTSALGWATCSRAFRAAWVALALVAIGGCTRRGGIPILNFLPLGKPVVLGLVTENPLDAVNPFSPYDPAIAALSHELSRPCNADLYLPFQADGNLQTGACQFAIVTPAQFVRLSVRDRSPPLVVACDRSGRASHPAVAVVRADSDVRELGQLRGKSVIFGPAGDSRSHWAALELLARHGIRQSDLALELFPVPGSLRHALTSSLALDAVANSGAVAAFLDELRWNDLPARPGSDTSGLTQAQFRVLGQTMALPDVLVVSSPKADPDLSRRVVDFLLHADRNAPEILRPLNFARFQKAGPELPAALERLAAVVTPTGEPKEK